MENPLTLYELRDAYVRGRERLADRRNWCPNGAMENNRYCAVFTLYKVMGLLHDDEYDETSWFKRQQLRSSLNESSSELYFQPFACFINDAPYLPEDERYQRVLAMYDHAIEGLNAKIASGK